MSGQIGLLVLWIVFARHGWETKASSISAQTARRWVSPSISSDARDLHKWWQVPQGTLRILCRVHSCSLTDEYRQEDGQPNFTSAIRGIALYLAGATRLPSLSWEAFCKSSPYKKACDDRQNLLKLGGRDPISYEYYSHKLVDHTNAQTEP